MNGSVDIAYIFIVILLVVCTSEGDPRSQTINLTCNQKVPNNQTISIPNFLQLMEKIGTQMGTRLGGTASTDTGVINSSYGLGECFGDLSTTDCISCYEEARKVLPTCLPYNGQVFLDGCFMRTQNYDFYEEYEGPNDKEICGNTTRSGVFRDSARQAVSDAVRDAPRNSGYFARKVVLSDIANESVYVLADCWGTLNTSSCTECLDNAFGSILKCLPYSEGRALHTGCFIRYSNANFLNPEPTRGNNGGNAISNVIQTSCGNTRATHTNFIPIFVQTMEIISTKMRNSQYGTAVAGTNNNKTYGLAQCYGDISSRECKICYAIARTALPACLPNTGGRVYLNGCFLRYETFNFFGESTGKEDQRICPNNIRKNSAFEQSVRRDVSQAVETATKSKNYHARTQALISGSANNSVFTVANCWSTLNNDSCGNCLQKAARSMLECLPLTEGYALYSGCFMRYSASNSSHHKRLSKGRKIAMAVSSLVAFLVVTFIALYAWKRRSKSKGKQGSEDTKLLKTLNSKSLNFKYATIEKATRCFHLDNKLGQGGFCQDRFN